MIEQLSQQESHYTKEWVRFAMYIIQMIVGFVLGLISAIVVDDRNRKRDKKDAFHAITAEIRAKMIEMKDVPDDFVRHSVIILRPAVYKVISAAKSRSALELCWKTYEEQNPEYFTASFRKADEILAGRTKDPQKIFSELLNQLDACVS